MSRACVLATLGDDPHTQGLFRVARIAQKAGLSAHVLAPGSSLDELLECVHRFNPGWLGLSYRLSPDVAVQQYRQTLQRLAAEGWLRHPNGQPRRIALAGLPESMQAVERIRAELPCEVWTMPQRSDPLGASARVLEFFDVAAGQKQRILAELKPELFPPRFPELDELASQVADNDDYRDEPPLPVPSARARGSYVERIREMDMPLLRTHFGVPAPTIGPTVAGIAALAEARVIDEISLGSSDLSQRYFGIPEAFRDRKNDGGVPYSSFEHLVEMFQASRRGNYPGMKPYAHVTGLVPFVETCLRAGMLTGAHQAVPLFWFNELDGRGPTPVHESIREHLATVRELARRGIPVEMNDPNHFSSRWAHDTVIVVDYALITAAMLANGVQDVVLQLQFNKPRETSDHGDLAKMLAGLDIARQMTDSAGARLWRETRTGIDSFDPDIDAARHQLARSTFLQLIVDPHAIHLVSYCEALHVAGVEDVIDGSKLVRRCVRVFRQHAGDRLRLRQHPLVVERRARLFAEAQLTLRYIAALDGNRPPPASATPAALVPRLADPDVLFRALDSGVLAAPGVFHPSYKAARNVVTAPVAHGFIECLDPETGAVRREQQRLSHLAA
ncbi:MAG: cobalamin B12-binding domain-containing protein [Planctomycetes bacterium]|nr:cobalamin B12-binding domain-containing protein [Planctomycetota bacterium]